MCTLTPALAVSPTLTLSSTWPETDPNLLQSLSHDFKSAVKELWGMLMRAQREVGVRFDVASSATLGEVLTLTQTLNLT